MRVFKLIVILAIAAIVLAACGGNSISIGVTQTPTAVPTQQPTAVPAAQPTAVPTPTPVPPTATQQPPADPTAVPTTAPATTTSSTAPATTTGPCGQPAQYADKWCKQVDLRFASNPTQLPSIVWTIPHDGTYRVDVTGSYNTGPSSLGGRDRTLVGYRQGTIAVVQGSHYNEPLQDGFVGDYNNSVTTGSDVTLKKGDVIFFLVDDMTSIPDDTGGTHVMVYDETP